MVLQRRGGIWDKKLSKSKKFLTGSMENGEQIMLLSFVVRWGCMLPAGGFQLCCKNIFNTAQILQVLSSLHRLRALPLEASSSTSNACFPNESLRMFASNCFSKPKELIPVYWSKEVAEFNALNPCKKFIPVPVSIILAAVVRPPSSKVGVSPPGSNAVPAMLYQSICGFQFDCGKHIMLLSLSFGPVKGGSGAIGRIKIASHLISCFWRTKVVKVKQGDKVHKVILSQCFKFKVMPYITTLI